MSHTAADEPAGEEPYERPHNKQITMLGSGVNSKGGPLADGWARMVRRF